MSTSEPENQSLAPQTPPLNGQDQLILKQLQDAFKKRLDNSDPALSTQEKEINDLIMAKLFPEAKTQAGRKWHMELLHVLLVEAWSEHIFLEFLFTAEQLKQIEKLIEHYEAIVKDETKKQQQLNQILLSLTLTKEGLKLKLVREIMTLQREIKQIYSHLGSEFKKMFEGLKDPDPNRSFTINIPELGELQVNYNDFISDIGDHVAAKIANGEVKMDEESIVQAVEDRATQYFAEKYAGINIDSDMKNARIEAIKSAISNNAAIISPYTKDILKKKVFPSQHDVYSSFLSNNNSHLNNLSQKINKLQDKHLELDKLLMETELPKNISEQNQEKSAHSQEPQPHHIPAGGVLNAQKEPNEEPDNQENSRHGKQR